MGLELEYIDGQTPLDEDEKEGLLVPTISTIADLNEFEQLNIDQAQTWILSKQFTIEQVLTEDFVRELHTKMFGNVWRWAGEFRKTDKNIGSDKYMIGIDLKTLLDDCKFWIDHNTYPSDEIAVRLSHRIVKIHCFANGNGRHSRMFADLINEKIFNNTPFTWGGVNLTKTGDLRKSYIQALQQADQGDYSALLNFVRE